MKDEVNQHSEEEPKESEKEALKNQSTSEGIESNHADEQRSKDRREEKSIRELLSKTWKAVWFRLTNLFSLDLDTDEAGTIENIQKSIEFKGGNLWALLLAAVIASIGLNTNSTAVIIGAMLISPLMGPIVGMGYSIGTNDLDTFKNSIRNLGISVAVSVTAATVYFLLSPLRGETSELTARTEPNLYDVLIAVCGGIIGIVAGSRRDRGNAIPGVAIATALMPPLCTVGYGLANLNWEFFAGALFLFVINTVFIVITTYIFVRVLGFPKKNFLNPRNEKRVTTIMYTLAIMIIIPSIFFAYTQIQEEVFSNRVKLFIKEEFESSEFHTEHPSTYLVKHELEYDKEPSNIVVMLSGDRLKETEIEAFRSNLKKYNLGNAKLEVRQGSDIRKYIGTIQDNSSQVGSELLEKVVEEKNQAITDMRTRLRELNEELMNYKVKEAKLKELQKNRVTKVVSVVFPEIEEYSFNKENIKNVRIVDSLGNFVRHRLDTIPLVTIKVSEKTHFKNKDRKRLADLLKIAMNLDTLQLVTSRE